MLLGSVVFAVAAAACAGDGVEISTAPLTGKVGGQSWTFVAGDTSAFLSDENDFFAQFYAATFTACGFSTPQGNSLIVAVPTKVGDYEMSLSRNMTFVVGDQNLIATDGRIVVDEVTATKVSGGLHATYDGDNEVDGRFEITICPED